jgi:septal ring factor EnvC (AmiA/AmiB activator)
MNKPLIPAATNNIMQEIYEEIKQLEKDIARVKRDFSIKAIDYKEARMRIRILNARLEDVLRKLPAHEREKHKLNKELGLFDTVRL